MRSLGATLPCVAPPAHPLPGGCRPQPAAASVWLPHRARQRRRRAAPLACAGAADGATASSPPQLRVTLRTAEARSSLRFDSVRGARGGSFVVVSAVALESEAHEAGIRAGDRLQAISDPVRPSVLWELRDNASLRFVRDALRLRVAPEVELLLSPGAGVAALTAQLALQQPEVGRDAQAVPAARPGLTVGQALEEVYAKQQDAAALPTVSQRRIRRREAYMDEVAQRDDSGFFATAAAVVLATPLTILAIAAANGWLTPSALH